MVAVSRTADNRRECFGVTLSMQCKMAMISHVLLNWLADLPLPLLVLASVSWEYG